MDSSQTFKCVKCDIPLGSKSLVDSHNRCFHTEKLETNQNLQYEQIENLILYNCSRCSYKSKHLRLSMDHMLLSHKNSQIKAWLNINDVHYNICTLCHMVQKFRESMSKHMCMTKIKDWECGLCKSNQRDSTFVDHILNKHFKGHNEVYYFETELDVTKWRIQFEENTKAKFYLHDFTGNIHIYNCAETSYKAINSTKIYACPATLMVKQLDKGYQVNICNTHYHKVSPYNFNTDSQCISSYFPIKNVKLDRYLQFKSLMERIVSEAAKIKVSNLNGFYERALKMACDLNQMTGPKDLVRSKKHIGINGKPKSKGLKDPLNLDSLDFDTSESEEDLKPLVEFASKPDIQEPVKQDKTESDVNTMTDKKEKGVESDTNPIIRCIDVEKLIDTRAVLIERDETTPSIKIVDTYSLKETNLDETPIKPKPIDFPKQTYNDTYKNFLLHNGTKIDKTVSKTKKKNSFVIGETIATKIDSAAKKKTIEEVDTKVGSAVKRKSIEEVTTNVVSNVPNKSVDVEINVQSDSKYSRHSSDTELASELVPRTFPKRRKRRKKMPAPKAVSPVKTPPAKITGYEVKKRKGDCNILVLKL